MSRPVAIGAMRLSTAGDRDDARAAQVLDAALAAGVTWLDTADVYAHDAADVGHNERLVAAAVARHANARVGAGPSLRDPLAPVGGSIPPRSGVTVVTKGGLVRAGKQWGNDGRAGHLTAAALASRERLGGEPIDLYLLHAPDPQVPLATSVRALARLVDDGVARRVGLSNVGRVQLDEALAITDIAAVEVELGPHDLDPILGGLVARCAERGIPVLAHRPLGGTDRARRWAKDRALRLIADRHGATPAEILLAWLRGLSPVIVPLPGPTTIASVLGVVRAASLVLDDDARAALDARFLGASVSRLSSAAPIATNPPWPIVSARSPTAGREVVILMGMPGAGKSTIAGDLVARGHLRLNRDERGGTLDGIAAALDQALAEGATAAVLDNTYATRASRALAIDAAARHGVPVHCWWLDTSIEDAQVNAASRLLERYDRLPEPAELNKLARRDPGAFRPTAQFNWRRDHEPPALDEGFATVERLAFRRAARAEGRPALVVDLDDVVRVGRPTRPDEVQLLPGAAAALHAWVAAGWAIAATSWQPAAAELAAVDARTVELLGTPLPIATCTHPPGPPICWCRKPMPGLGLLLARRHRLDLARSIHIGKGAPDRGFAERLGMRFADPAALHAPPPALP